MLRSWWLIFVFCFAACEEEEQALPPYKQDLAEIYTAHDGRAKSLVFDDGRTRIVYPTIGGFPADTVLRIQVLYEENGENVRLVQAAHVFSPFPIQMHPDSIKRDPLKVKTAWRTSSRYVNLLITRKTGGKSQTFAFVNKGIQKNSEGKRKWTLELYHDQGADPLYYSEDHYFSCPTHHYADSLQQGIDSVEIIVPTQQGAYRKAFLY